VIHGGDVLSHMYWATGALTLVGLANFIAIAHLARAERMIQELRALCEKNGIEYGDD
jgi:ribosomal protein L7Ae-like RNA K-turn-binding protein